jgi:hypothetical protein
MPVEKSYTVYELSDGERQDVVTGLKLDEAFARMMALAGSTCTFARFGGVMRAVLTRTGPFPDLPFLDQDPEMIRELFPRFESANADNEQARREIMEQALKHGRDNMRAEPDRIKLVA